MSSNSLGRNLQVNRLDVNALNVNALNVNNNNNNNNNLSGDISGYTKDDERLVLITLNLRNAHIKPDINNSRRGRIIFSVNNMKLTEWEDRTLNSEKQHRSYYNHEKEDALRVFRGLFDKNIQGKRNAIENPPNALTIVNCGNENENEVYLTIMGYEESENEVSIMYELEEGDQNLEEMSNAKVKMVIDTFRKPPLFAIIPYKPDSEYHVFYTNGWGERRGKINNIRRENPCGFGCFMYGVPVKLNPDITYCGIDIVDLYDEKLFISYEYKYTSQFNPYPYRSRPNTLYLKLK